MRGALREQVSGVRIIARRIDPALAQPLLGPYCVTKHGIVGLVALWSLVAALAFSGTLLTWLVFADAIAVGVLALADLTAHEATTEKVVHQLVVHDTTQAEQRTAA